MSGGWRDSTAVREKHERGTSSSRTPERLGYNDPRLAPARHRAGEKALHHGLWESGGPGRLTRWVTLRRQFYGARNSREAARRKGEAAHS